jgi:hypothetical protein
MQTVIVVPAIAAKPRSPRIGDLLVVVDRPAADERMNWFARPHLSEPDCLAACEQAAHLPYRRESPARPPRAEVYEIRGFNNDRQLEANTGVLAALDAIRSQVPGARLSLVLVVGPRLEFAPRAGLGDLPPQSFPPYFCWMDCCAASWPARAPRLCSADINPHVIEFLRFGAVDVFVVLRKRRRFAIANYFGFSGARKEIGVKDTMRHLPCSRSTSHVTRS